MNINNVYEAEIGIVNYNDPRFTSFFMKTLVYKGKYNDYYDLTTGQRYVVGRDLCERGEVFIVPNSMVPISEIIEAKKENMLKCRILRKYKKHNIEYSKMLKEKYSKE